MIPDDHSSCFIALIRPNFKPLANQVTYPLGLGYLANALRTKKYKVRIYDLNILKISNSEIVKYLEDKNINFIGITALTFYFESMVELTKLFKTNPKFKNVPVILGGIHVSSLPEYSLRKTNADFVVIGEGEKTIVELIDCLIQNKSVDEINGISYIKDGKYYQTKPRELINNLDDIKPPAWDLMYPLLYPNTPHSLHFKATPVFPIFSSRGCPFECSYCASKNFWQKRIRFHSVKRIVDEIEFLIKTYNAKEFHIWDDNFTLNRNRVIDFCREIKRRHINVYFAAPNGLRIDTLDRTVLTYMKAAGFYSLTLAIETGSQRVQTYIKKFLNLKKVPSIASTAHDLGFIIRSFFIIGFPTETINEVHRTINFANKLKVDQANVFFFTPLPGSSLFYEWMKEQNQSNISWNFDFMHNPQIFRKYSKISPKDLSKLFKLFYIKFFINKPIRLIKLILRIRPYHYIFYLKYLLNIG